MLYLLVPFQHRYQPYTDKAYNHLSLNQKPFDIAQWLRYTAYYPSMQDHNRYNRVHSFLLSP